LSVLLPVQVRLRAAWGSEGTATVTAQAISFVTRKDYPPEELTELINAAKPGLITAYGTMRVPISPLLQLQVSNLAWHVSQGWYAQHRLALLRHHNHCLRDEIAPQMPMTKDVDGNILFG
jgi:hypothetical protein